VIAGLILTSGPLQSPQQLTGRGRKSHRREELVDQRPLDAARSLAAVATTHDELDFAQDAVRLADLEVDMAFETALRSASQQPVTKPGRELEGRIDRAQAAIKALQSKAKELARESARAKGANLSQLQQQTALTQAQLELAHDELADAEQDLQRTSNSRYSQIEREWQEHKSAEHTGSSTRLPAAVAAPSNISPRSLVGRARAWSDLVTEKRAIADANQYVAATIGELTRQHDALEASVRARQVGKQTAAPAPSMQPAGAAESSPAPPSISTLHQLSQDEINMADLDRRIQDLRSLTAVYANWSALTQSRESAAARRLIRSVLWIALTLLVAIAAGWLIGRFFDRITLERKQRITLRGVSRFAIEVLAALAILLVLFGSPNHLFTVLGLAGAGLAVTLKDFVVAFCGWLVLMGRNGVRVGDWVEINGVRGEVVEVGVLRTVLLETGNWTEAGHPTGRQVAFLNSYAVEGYFFNFSTAGQWMWDELPVLIPSGEDPYPLAERIRAAVAAETERDQKIAEAEWTHAARNRSDAGAFSAAPEINLKPSDAGVHLIVRYVTRASERYQVRARLSHAVVKLLRHGEAILPPADSAAPPPEAAAPDERQNRPVPTR
ncbi:MAG: mechanosensitive ion channel domain-containing protein, partial [Terriglobia bacterium]